MDRLGTATEDVASLVWEPLGELISTFCMKSIDEGVADQHRGVQRSAICFDPAGDVDCIAKDRELQPPVAANVALDHIAVMDADGNPVLNPDGTNQTVDVTTQTGDFLAYTPGLTRNWTYATASQLTPDGRVAMSTYSASSDGAGTSSWTCLYATWIGDSPSWGLVPVRSS